ncbi:aldehyde dehydrogenase family protein [Bacillus pacificus]
MVNHQNIILEDADLEEAINGAFKVLCIITAKIVVLDLACSFTENITKQIVNELVKMANNVKLGAGMERRKQKWVHSYLKSNKSVYYITLNKGKAEGATVAAGGERAFEKGYFCTANGIHKCY